MQKKYVGGRKRPKSSVDWKIESTKGSRLELKARHRLKVKHKALHRLSPKALQ